MPKKSFSGSTDSELVLRSLHVQRMSRVSSKMNSLMSKLNFAVSLEWFKNLTSNPVPKYHQTPEQEDLTGGCLKGPFQINKNK